MGPVSFDAIDRQVSRSEALALAGMLKAEGIRVDLIELDDNHHRFMVRSQEGTRARQILDTP